MNDCDWLNGSISFNVLDIDIYLSYYVSILAVCVYDASPTQLYEGISSESSADVSHLRRDHAPFQLYHEHTRQLCVPVLDSQDSLLASSDAPSEIVDIIDPYYSSLADLLRESANLVWPQHKKYF